MDSRRTKALFLMATCILARTLAGAEGFEPSPVAPEADFPGERPDTAAPAAVEQSPPNTPGHRVLPGTNNAVRPIFLPRELADILRLTKAGLTDEVIVAYVNRSPFDYTLTPYHLVKLKEVGVAPRVLTALLEHRGWVPVPQDSPPSGFDSAYIPGPPPLPAVISQQDFFSALAPYGKWHNVPELGWCWQPAEAASDTGWRPYATNGYWLLSNGGWYWNSGYPWGWAPFHHGRWTKKDGFGWLWRPGTDWAPAWVCWRRGPDFCGWAPLPLGAGLAKDAGWSFNGTAVGQDAEFGLESDDFTYVPLTHFVGPDWETYRLERDPAELFGQSRAENKYSYDAQGRVNNWGLKPEALQTAGVIEIPRIDLVDRASPLWKRPKFEVAALNRPTQSPPEWTGNGMAYQERPAQAYLLTPTFQGAGLGAVAYGGSWDQASVLSGWGEHWLETATIGAGTVTTSMYRPFTVHAILLKAPRLGCRLEGTCRREGLIPMECLAAPGRPRGQPNLGLFLTIQGLPRPKPNGPRGYLAESSGNSPPGWARSRLGLGSFEYGRLGGGMLGAVRKQAGSAPWPSLDGRLGSGLSPYGTFGLGGVQNGGGGPWYPFNTPASFPNNGPVYGVPGVPIIGNNEANPYLPFGQSVPQFGPSCGIAPSAPGMTSPGGGFAYLPRAPMLPGAPILPRSPTLPGAPTLPTPGAAFSGQPISPSLRQFGRWPSAQTAPSAPSASRGYGGAHPAAMGGGGAAATSGAGAGSGSGGR